MLLGGHLPGAKGICRLKKETETRLGGELRSRAAADRLAYELRHGVYAEAEQLPIEV